MGKGQCTFFGVGYQVPQFSCRPGEAENSEVPPSAANAKKAKIHQYKHCLGAPAYADVVTPSTISSLAGAVSGTFRLDCMLCNIGAMLKVIGTGVGMAYTTFSCKVGGADTPGKVCTVYLVSKPMFGSMNLVNLLLIIRVLDIALEQDGVALKDRLIKPTSVQRTAKSIFTAFRLRWENTTAFSLYSMGRSTGGWWLGLGLGEVTGRVQKAFIDLMNHSVKVALKFYWGRSACKYFFGNTECEVQQRPNGANLTVEVTDNLLLPVEEGAQRAVLRHAAELAASDPQVKQYYDDMREANNRGGVKHLTLQQQIQALTGLLAPGYPVADWGTGGYNFTRALQVVPALFHCGFQKLTSPQCTDAVRTYMELPLNRFDAISDLWMQPAATIQLDVPQPQPAFELASLFAAFLQHVSHNIPASLTGQLQALCQHVPTTAAANNVRLNLFKVDQQTVRGSVARGSIHFPNWANARPNRPA